MCFLLTQLTTRSCGSTNTRTLQITTLHYNPVVCARQLSGNSLNWSNTGRGNFELWTGGLTGAISKPGDVSWCNVEPPA